MKTAAIAMFKEKLQKFAKLSAEYPHFDFFVSSIGFKSLLFTFRIKRSKVEPRTVQYCLIVHLVSSVFNEINDDGDYRPVPLDLFSVNLSHHEFISAFCILSKLDKILSK